MGRGDSGGSSAPVDSHLVASYLAPPEFGASMVMRSGLVDRLSDGMRGQVTIVSGEAASGKTSLLVQWVSSGAAGSAVAWVTVPEATDEITFWEYLLAALAPCGVQLDDLGAALADGEPPGDAWLTSLANRLGRHQSHLTVVIDDLHEMGSLRGLESLGSLIEKRPAGVSFVVATRVLPPWPLARWRMDGRLTEVGSSDLGITLAEARELLASGGIEVNDDEVARLVERTEGWFGGVRLAVLAMQRTSEPGEFVARLATETELVSTYLLRNVLATQDDVVTRFLLDISVLDVASAELCDELREATDSAELLERCRTANLFLSRVGDDTGAYRVHALFRELLRAQLGYRDPERLAELHRRASRLYERVGEVEQAISHAVAGGDDDRLTALVLAHAPDFAHQGRFDALRRWATTLKRSGPTESHETLLALAAALCFSGQGAESLELLGELDVDALPEHSRTLSAHLAGAAHIVLGDVHLLREIGADLRQEASGQLTDRPGSVLGQGLFFEGIGTFFEGDLDAAAEVLELADRPENRPGPPAFIAVRSWEALVALRRGDLAHAEQCVRVALERRDQLSSGDTAAVATALLTSAELAWERNLLDEAEARFARARRSVQPMPWQAVLVECARSRLTVSLGQPQQALEDLTEVGKLYVSGSSSPLLLAQVADRAVDVCLRLGDAEAALGWARNYEICQVGELPWASRIRLARAVERARPDDLVGEAMEAREPLPRRIETLLAAALAVVSAEDRIRARCFVGEALTLAAPGRMIRRFVDGGPTIASLVAELVADPRLCDGPAFSPFFAAEVVDACEAEPRRGLGGPAPVVGELVEQLSVRELDVLALLAKGLSYSEMGEELYVSRNTIKSHVQHVYTKLGVASRSHAVELGRRLGLI